MPIKVIEEQNKVVLTQEQAETIKNIKKEHAREGVVIAFHMQNNWSKGFKCLRELDLDTLICALYRPEDITIEQTVEEQILERYESYVGYGFERISNQAAWQEGFRVSLNIIGMKVKGINA